MFTTDSYTGIEVLINFTTDNSGFMILIVCTSKYFEIHQIFMLLMMQTHDMCTGLHFGKYSLMSFDLQVCLVFVAVASIILYRVIIDVNYCTSIGSVGCLIAGTLMSSVLNAVAILVLGKIYDILAIKLTDWGKCCQNAAFTLCQCPLSRSGIISPCRESSDSDPVRRCLNHQIVCISICQQLLLSVLHSLLQRGEFSSADSRTEIDSSASLLFIDCCS